MVEENKEIAASEQTASTTQGAGSLNDLSGQIELIDDNIIFNEEFKKNVAIPYFKDIYKDLAAQSDAKSKGINKVSILNVSTQAENSKINTCENLSDRLQNFYCPLREFSLEPRHLVHED